MNESREQVMQQEAQGVSGEERFFRMLHGDGAGERGTRVAVGQMRPDPPLRGEAFWRWGDGVFVRVRRFLHRALPQEYNPLLQLGAIANVTFVIALVTGILLLFWYVPSVHQAYASLEGMRQSPLLAQLSRSLHRYSSDACMLFALLHGVQVVFSRRVGGARWLAWVTGILLVGTMWFDSWLGYWLVWDDRAALIAKGTAKMLDVLPIFSQPLGLSFLTDKSVGSLLFFLVFFFHMLIPLGFGVLVWLHISRLGRAKFFTSLRMAGVILLSLVVLSLLFPALSSKPARMQEIPARFAMDWFTMLPLFFTQRLGGGALWSLFLGVGVCLMSMPWWLSRRAHQVAQVVEPRCNACQSCFNDCPFGAITMLPRKDESGKRADVLVSRIDPAKCVGCGICVGSCDSTAIALPTLDAHKTRKVLDGWLAEAEEAPVVAFLCADSAASALEVDLDEGRCEALPGVLVMPVPCVGWINMHLVERVIRRGAAGVLIASCGPDPNCRLGESWLVERLGGHRDPGIREDKLRGTPVRAVQFDRTQGAAFLRFTRSFREDCVQLAEETSGISLLEPTRPGLSWWARGLRVVLALVVLGGLTYGLSAAPSGSPERASARLVISLKHAGRFVKEKVAARKREDKNLLPHMRGAVTTKRKRADVRLRVWVDGALKLQRSYRAGGVFRDGFSIGLVRLSLSPGAHRIRLQVGDSEDPKEWRFDSQRTMTFRARAQGVILFTRGGFQWHAIPSSRPRP